MDTTVGYDPLLKLPHAELFREARRLRGALRAIADGEDPCCVCGEPHELRDVPNSHRMQSWADPDDGHSYRRMDLRRFARAVLDED